MSANTAARHPAEHPPIGRTMLILLAAVVAGGGACLWAVTAAPEESRPFVAACIGAAAALLCAVAAVAAYGSQADRHHRRRVAAMEADTALLADEILPVAVQRLRDGATVESAMAEVPQPAHRAHQRILRTLVEEIGRSERMRAATMSACANAAGRVQALATSMLADLREMEHRYDEEVLGDLLRLDHRTAQAGRLADSIAVLSGARSGRRWTKPIVMESVLRGAVGRIAAYQRVRLHSTSTVAVAGYAAEGVMHALAELMDNATSFSPPTEEVHVYVEEAYAGVIVTIEDGGLVMSPAALRRAERAVSSEPLDLTTLSGTRLGLAVVGCLARKYGLTVSYRPSSRGGTGVVVMIPRNLITEPREEPAPAAPLRREPPPSMPDEETPDEERSAEPEPAAKAQDTENDTEKTPGGLPKRRRGRTLASAPQPASRPKSTRSPADAGARFAAFHQAGRGSSAAEGAPAQEEEAR